jgi:hypothetical protein
VRRRPLAGLEIAQLQPAEALARVAGEPTNLAELTVVDHVESGLDLLVDDLFDGAGQALVELVLASRGHHLSQVDGPRQDAGVRHDDPVSASLHFRSSFFSVAGGVL